MKPIRYAFPGLCSLALINAPMLSALAAGTPDDSWQTVSEETLSNLRGGVDLGPLVGNFTIQRVVQIDGQVVARMQIVISNLTRLGQGGMPTISLSGPLAELVQVFNPPGVSTPSTAPTTAAATPITTSPSSAVPAPTTSGPYIGSTSGNSGTTSTTGTQTGSTAQFGAGISQAVAAANGAAGANAAAPATANPSPTSVAATQTSTAPLASTTGATMTPATTISATTAAAPASATTSAQTSAQTSSTTIPVGNTGQVIVVSNIPNASAITSEVQNSVQATRIQTLTTITATLNSLQLLSAAEIANAVRQQIAAGH